MNLAQTRKILYWPWLSLPLVLLSYLLCWNSLPEQMGVHIGLNGKTDGWMSRESSLLFSLGTLFVVLTSFTWQMKWRGYINKRLIFRYYAGAIIFTGVMLFTLLRNLP